MNCNDNAYRSASITEQTGLWSFLLCAQILTEVIYIKKKKQNKIQMLKFSFIVV